MSTGTEALAGSIRKARTTTAMRRIKRHWELYLLVLLPVAHVILFRYVPMYGIQIAFKDFVITKGIMGSPWAGLKYFKQLFGAYQFQRIVLNTLGISLLSIALGFPVPIILAVALNEARSATYKKVVQMVTYAPYFISTVVMVGMLLMILSANGIVSQIIQRLGGEPVNVMSIPESFKFVYVLSGIWQGAGYGAVIYLAALSAIDPQLHEAAIIDGANKLQRIWNIDLPGIMPTAVIVLILNLGQVMNVGFEKIFLMQNPLNMRTSDVISTYVYRTGLVGAQYSFATAVGLFNSVVNLILIILVNQIAKRVSETSLW
jgi:putative aldouronate transport system permease protein